MYIYYIIKNEVVQHLHPWTVRILIQRPVGIRRETVSRYRVPGYFIAILQLSKVGKRSLFL